MRAYVSRFILCSLRMARLRRERVSSSYREPHFFKKLLLLLLLLLPTTTNTTAFGRWRFQLFRETPLKSESEEIKDERSIVAVCVEDDDDDDNKNRDKNNPKKPPIVSSIKRVRPLLDDVNANSAAANVDDANDDDEIFEIVAASF